MANPPLSLYDRLSGKKPAPPTSGAGSLYDRLTGGAEAPDTVARLRLLDSATADTTPDVAAEASVLSYRTGLAHDLVARNLEDVRRAYATPGFDPETFVKSSPKVAAWLAEDAARVAMTRDDRDNLSSLERIFGQWRLAPRAPLRMGGDPTMGSAGFGLARPVPEQTAIGTLQQSSRRGWAVVEAGQFGHGIQIGHFDATDPEILRLADAWVAETNRELPEARGPFEYMLRAAAEILPSTLYTAGRAIEGGVVGAAVGAAAGTAAGFGGSAAGAKFGAEFGAGAAAFMAAAEMEGGNATLQFLTMRDAEGRRMDPRRARAGGFAVSVASGLLETAGFALITAPLASAARRLVVKDALKEALTVPTVRAAFVRGVTEYAKGVGGEVATEVAQQGTQLLAEQLATQSSNLQDGTAFDAVTYDRVKRELTDTFIQTLAGMALVGLPGPTLNTIGGIAEGRRAERDQAFIAALGPGAEAAKLRERAPTEFRGLIETLTKDGPVENILWGAEQFGIYWQAQGLDPALVAQELTGDPTAFEQARERGGDLVIPTAMYAEKIAGTVHHEAAMPDLRLRPGALTGRERAALAEETPSAASADEVAAVAGESTPSIDSEQVFDEERNRLIATGQYTEEQAETQARISQAVYDRFAPMFGVSPLTLYRARVRSVFGPEQAAPIYAKMQELQQARAANDRPAMQRVVQELEGLTGLTLREAPTAMNQAAPVTAAERDTFNALEAHEMREEQPDATPQEIATALSIPVASVEQYLAAPKPALDPEAARALGLRVGFLAQAATRDLGTMNVRRGARVTADRVRLSADEQGAIDTIAAELEAARQELVDAAVAAVKATAKASRKKPSRAALSRAEREARAKVDVTRRTIERQVREIKAAFPEADGWAPLTLTGLEDIKVSKKGEITWSYSWKAIPYEFDRAPGKSVGPREGTPDYERQVTAAAAALVDEVRSVVARAQAGDVAAQRIIAQRGWYKNMRQRLRREFGALGDTFADLLGAMSPNTPVRTNWKNAVDFLRRATVGDFDELMPQWVAWTEAIEAGEAAFRGWFDGQVTARGLSPAALRKTAEWRARRDEMAALRVLPDELMPRNKEGAKYGFNGKNAVRAIVGLWRTVRVLDPDIARGGQAPKALNFSGNLIGFRSRATIDVWAARMLQRLTGKTRVPSPAESTVNGNMLPDGRTTSAFGFGQEVFARAAEVIRADESLEMPELGDDDLQAVVWFVEKELWTRNNWTSAAGEGGSFEFEADLQGSTHVAAINGLRRVMDSSLSTPQEREDAAAALADLARTVDRYVIGLSMQQSAGTNGVDFIPDDDAQSVVLQGLRAAIYGAENVERVVASKAVSTEGRYWGDVERSVDVEAVVTEGFDPTPLWREMVRVAQANGQDSVFLSRVLRADEPVDLERHRPGIELYFADAAIEKLEGRLAAITQALAAAEAHGFTITMDGRPTGTVSGAPGRPVGVRLQYVPEFDRRYAADRTDLTLVQLEAMLVQRRMALGDLADRLMAEVEGVSFAGRFDYETRVAFSHEYDQELSDGPTDAVGESAAGALGAGRRWEGRSIRDGLASADRQSVLAQSVAERPAEPGDAARGDANAGVAPDADRALARVASYLEQRAFHGSPHIFPRFTTAKMGTGEGSQAFGWGLYFAENPAVSASYIMAGRNVGFNNRDVPIVAADKAFAQANGDRDKAIALLRAERDKSRGESRRLYLSMAMDIVRRGATRASLYQVAVADDAVATYLDWDAPASPAVLAAIRKAIPADDLERFEDAVNAPLEEWSGSEAYRRLSRYASENALPGDDVRISRGDEAASKYLLREGVRGIKFLDAGSRLNGGTVLSVAQEFGGWVGRVRTAAGFEVGSDAFATQSEAQAWADAQVAATTTRNLVVFDENDITITHRNGEPVTAAEKAQYLEQAREGTGAPYVEQVPVAQLAQYREFQRTPSEEMIEDIRQNGVREPLLLEYSVADHALRLTEGNTRLAAAEALGMSGVPVSVVRREGSFPRQAGANAPVPLSGPRPTQRLPEQFAPSMILPLPATIDIDGVQRPTTNSTGQPIHPTEDGVRNFWKWFGDSKWVDEEGRPRVAYKAMRGDVPNMQDGTGLTFIAPDEGSAARWSGPHRPVRAVYVKMTNPWDFRVKADRKWLSKAMSSPAKVEQFNRQTERIMSGGVFDKAMADAELTYLSSETAADLADSIEMGYYQTLEIPVVTETIKRRGHDAIFVSEDGDTGVEPNIAVYDGAQLKEVSNSGEFGPTANIMRQDAGAGSAPNAFIVRGVDAAIIGLMRTANFSSFSHEMGHEYWTLLRDAAAMPDAPAQVKADWDATKAYVGHVGDGPLSVDAEEKLARTWEKYLEEGRAPTRALDAVFARMAVWFKAVYREAVKWLGFGINAEIRGVMDRMLASEEEIAAQRGSIAAPLAFRTAEEANATEAEFAATVAAQARASQVAEAALTAQLLEERQRESRSWWRIAEEAMRATVTAEVDADLLQRAVVAMRDDTAPDHVRLSRAAVAGRFGDAEVGRLPFGIWARKGEPGVDADAAALTYGFASGDELVRALRGYEARGKRIARLTAERMEAEYPTLRNDSAAMTEAAQDALHSEAGQDAIVAELLLIGRSTGSRTPPNVPRLMAQAEAQVRARSLRTLQPHRFYVAEGQAARKAYEAVKRGDYGAAEQYKRQQLLNHMLYRAARAAEATVDRGLKFARRMGEEPARARLGKADESFLAAMDALWDQYDLRRVANKTLDNRTSLLTWRDKMLAEGREVRIDAAVLAAAERRNYREVPIGEFLSAVETAQQIDHTARRWRNVEGDRAERLYEENVAEGLAKLAEHRVIGESVPAWGKSSWARAGEFVAKLDAAHVKPEFLFRWLDNDQPGGWWWTNLFKPLADAENAEQQMARDATAALDAIFGRIPPETRARWLTERLEVPGMPGSPFTKANLIALALNWGNDGNREAIRVQQFANGKVGYTDGEVGKMLALLSDAELQMVNELWAFVDSFWPMISDLQQEMTGLRPEKVEATPFLLDRGNGVAVQMRGGYYPLKYDSERSVDAITTKREEAADLKELFGAGSFLKAQTKDGHTQERIGSGGKVVSLELNVLTSHLLNVIHDLTHRKAIVQVHDLLADQRIRAAIRGTAGKAMYDTLEPWLVGIAGERRDPSTFLERAIGRARVGATMVNMGFKVTTAITQPLGLLQSYDLVGTRYMNRGVAAMLSDPKGMRDLILEKSEAMRHRQTSFDREVRDTLKRITVQGKLSKAQELAFWATGAMDMMVAMPTWYGAYLQSIETLTPGDEAAAIAHADSSVRLSQGSGMAKDLAAIQRGSELRRMFTMFYSYFSVAYNLLRRSLERHGINADTRNLPRLAASMLALWFLPALLSELVARRGPEDDEDAAAWAAELLLKYPFMSVVGVRDVVGALGPDAYDYELSPVVDAIRAVPDALNAVGDAELTESEAKTLLNAVGYWGHLPTRQMWITGQGLFRLMQGDEDWSVLDLGFTPAR